MNDCIIPIENARDYILAGKATVIFFNQRTGKSVKYKIKQARINEDVWYVESLNIRTVLNDELIFIGTIKREYNIITQDRNQFNLYLDRKYADKHVQLLKDAFKAMWQRILLSKWPKDETEYMQILHDGTCLRCGRPLNDPISVKTGFGPECRRELGIKI
jgi:hypothetical protein